MTEQTMISINRITQIAFVIATALLILFFALLVWRVVSDAPDNADLQMRQEQIIRNQQSVICLLLVEPENRDENAIARCQVVPPFQDVDDLPEPGE